MNIAQLQDRTSAHFPDRPAIICEGRTITYREMRRWVEAVARGLDRIGLTPGDRVVLYLPNVPEFAACYLAAEHRGLVVVSASPMLTTAEMRHLITDSGARLVFTTADLVERLGDLVGGPLSAQQVVICLGTAFGYPSLTELSIDAEQSLRPVDLDPSAPAAILYTSGTTGQQKGAVLSHGNVISNVLTTIHCLRIDPTDRLLLFLPLFHCFGQNFIMNSALISGAALVMHRRFEPDQILKSIVADEVTMFFAVPTVYINLLATAASPSALGGVRYWFSAAATLPVEVAQNWRQVHGVAIHEGYGLTETSPFATYNHEWRVVPGSVGTPIDMVEVKVVDPDDHEVPPGTWGEICIRGPNVMLGYWNRPEETAEALRGGWFHSGDIGYLDSDGYLFLVDRVKDMINSAGFKIWPREVEEVIYQYPGVQECAVVGVPDAIKGETCRAYVVPRQGTTISTLELESFCRQRLATYKIPASFALLDGIPKNPTGKILKRMLRETSTT